MEPFAAIMIAFVLFIAMCMMLCMCRKKFRVRDPDTAENGPLTGSGKGFDYKDLV